MTKDERDALTRFQKGAATFWQTRDGESEEEADQRGYSRIRSIVEEGFDDGCLAHLLLTIKADDNHCVPPAAHGALMAVEHMLTEAAPLFMQFDPSDLDLTDEEASILDGDPLLDGVVWGGGYQRQMPATSPRRKIH